MKKLLVLISIAMLLVVAIPAGAVDVGKYLGASEATIVLDGELIAGRTFNSTYSVTPSDAGDIETLTLTAKQHEWLIQTEIGLKFFDIARPFWGYETVTGIYNEKTYGIDLMVPVAGIDIGVRSAYVKRDDYKIAETDYWFAGLRVKF